MASRGNGASKASLFLIELIITIFFFSLAGVVCMRLFIYAHSVSEDSVNTTQAVRVAQNAAESFMAAQGDSAAFERLLQMCLYEGAFSDEPAHGAALYTACFDSDWHCTGLTRGTETGEADYLARLTLSGMDEPGDACLKIAITGRDGGEIYTLQVEQYRQKGGRPE